MGFVYLINIEKTDYYKIGFTVNKPEKRLKQLQTGNCEKLVLSGFYESNIYVKLEGVLHRMLSHKKFKFDDFENLKGEWFILDHGFVMNFKTFCENIEKNIVFLNKKSTLFQIDK